MFDDDVIAELVEDPFAWYAALYDHPLYPDQLELATAVEHYIEECAAGRLEPIEVVSICSRQSGKNETSGRLEARLMAKYACLGGSTVKSAPCFKPQLLISKQRLLQCLANPLQQNAFQRVENYILQQGKYRTVFLSGEPSANRVGETCSTLLEVDEAQDYDKEVYYKDLRPMLATSGAPTVLYGTAWGADTLLEEKRQTVRERQKKLGVRLLFESDWQVRARYNDQYRRTVESEMDRLGADHPLIITQYCLQSIAALGRLFSPQDLVKLRGTHPRGIVPKDETYYVAGVDLCGADEQREEDMLLEPDANRKRDSTVATIAELRWRWDIQKARKLPILRIVDHLYMAGTHPNDCATRLYDFVFNKWQCVKVCVDARGVGDGVAKMLESRRPSQVVALKSGSTDVSRMGFGLLGAVKTGRLTMYRDDEDSETAQQFWLQAEQCRREVLPSGRLKFQAPTTMQPAGPTGQKVPIHDDFVKSLGYLVEAAEQHLYNAASDPSFYSAGTTSTLWTSQQAEQAESAMNFGDSW